jgi:hypothetical protein
MSPEVTMPASCSLYHTIGAQIAACAPQVPPASQERLAVLVTGIVGAGSCVQAAVAREVAALGVTTTTRPDSIGRRVRRTLNDPHLTATNCYGVLLAELVSDNPDPTQPLVLVLDESTKRDQVHLLRLSLSYRGGSVPVAWAVWEQNTPLPPGAYWAAVDRVLEAAAARLPADRPVVVLADRAYAVANLIDRLTARGWSWAIRITTTGRHRFRPVGQDEGGLADLVAARLPRPGRRFRCWGTFAKKAGWRPAHLVGLWGVGQADPLVIVTDRPQAWATIHLYERRFWIEPGFRLDKRKGWDWEACQVRDVAHHTVLLLALAWATVVVLCLGAVHAERALVRLRHRAGRHRPRTREHARQSLASLGRAAVRSWLYCPPDTPLRWTLPDRNDPSWNERWIGEQIHDFLFAPPVRP